MEGTRGSEKLGTGEIAAEDLDRLAGFGELDGVELVGWHRKGIPAIEQILGTFHAQPDAAGTVVQGLATSGLVGGLHVFPKGIPAVTLVEIQFDTAR